MKKLFVLLFLILMVIPAYAADEDTVYIADIETWVEDLLGGTGTSSIWTSTVIRSQVRLNCREHATLISIPAEDTILSVNDQTDYALNSDFLTIRGVLRLSEGRKKMMRQKAIDEKTPFLKGLGEEPIDANEPRYYAVKGGKIQMLVIDPPEADAGTDTFIVSYNAYATKLVGADSLTNIPYAGIAVVVYGTYLNLLMMNRELTSVQLMIPFVEKRYTTLFNAVKAQEQSSSDYDPKARPSQ